MPREVGRELRGRPQPSRCNCASPCPLAGLQPLLCGVIPPGQLKGNAAVLFLLARPGHRWKGGGGGVLGVRQRVVVFFVEFLTPAALRGCRQRAPWALKLSGGAPCAPFPTSSCWCGVRGPFALGRRVAPWLIVSVGERQIWAAQCGSGHGTLDWKRISSSEVTLQPLWMHSSAPGEPCLGLALAGFRSGPAHAFLLLVPGP